MRRRGIAAALALRICLAGCARSEHGAQFATSGPPSAVSPGAMTSTSAASTLSGTVTIFAASSLKPAFEQIARDFRAANPGVTVTPITYDGSSTLALQLTNGAIADVFAAADDSTMKTVVDAGLTAGTPVRFVSNTLQIAVAAGNPKGIMGLADLSKPGVDLVICDDKVPCGAASLKAAAAANVTFTPVSKEQNVSAVLAKVVSGDADAGLVYRTDLKSVAAGKVLGIDFPQSAQAVNNYPIAVLKEAPNSAVAASFRDFVATGPGQQVLANLGFAKPTG